MSEFIVAVKPQYLVTNSSQRNSSDKAPADEDDKHPVVAEKTEASLEQVADGGIVPHDKKGKSGNRNKKRPRDTRVAQEDRLCTSASRGDVCRFVSISEPSNKLRRIIIP